MLWPIYAHTPSFSVWQLLLFYFECPRLLLDLKPLFFQSRKLLKISSWLEGTHLKSKFLRIERNKCKEVYLNLCKGEGSVFFSVGWITAHYNSIFVVRSSIHFHTFKWVRTGGGEYRKQKNRSRWICLDLFWLVLIWQ